MNNTAIAITAIECNTLCYVYTEKKKKNKKDESEDK